MVTSVGVVTRLVVTVSVTRGVTFHARDNTKRRVAVITASTSTQSPVWHRLQTYRYYTCCAVIHATRAHVCARRIQ